MTTICVVQARYGSSRLPGKVLEPVGGTPMLVGILNRLRNSTLIEEIIVATTTDDSDDPVSDSAVTHGFDVVRGSRFDVLDRFHDVLRARPKADVIVRITADCPFVDPALVDEVIQAREDCAADFASNRLPPPYRRTFPVGLDVEVCTAAALDRAWSEASEPYFREHVMPYLYTKPGAFKTHILHLPEDLSRYRWTVDTSLDLKAVREIAGHLPPASVSWRDVLAVVRAHPYISGINAHEGQKPVQQTDERWSDDSLR